GTLGDRAAKSIGANNLLVRASAYYHDLGKTENPQFFIENQFGISNPHDHMPPEESAQAIRQHVIDGVSLAKKYRIPALVADSVVAHHGDGIMRYFYHKAIERYGEENVNVDDFRHHGHKPRTKENAILMMADALEGASRAVFADDDPSPEKIRRVVEQVVGEKVGDGQLSESALTLGELTKVKEAFVDALIGHYHQRIPYPDFPEAPPSPGGSRAETTESSRTVVVSADAEEEPSPTDVTNVEFRP
ncbi:MAG: HDIG domain-containing protein, partial [Acidimicrobiia bacterium]|nr:HDIG domain-containing protein [Acidimicrobiia bacterium]